MLDMQKERLRHLMANAILELWKKETGSMSSVFIEGTVCITARNGRTTVVQVSDKFPGSIPDDADYFMDSERTSESSPCSKSSPTRPGVTDPSPSRGGATDPFSPQRTTVGESPSSGEGWFTTPSRCAKSGGVSESFSRQVLQCGAKRKNKMVLGGNKRLANRTTTERQQLGQQLDKQLDKQLGQQGSSLQLLGSPIKDSNNNNSSECYTQLACTPPPVRGCSPAAALARSSYTPTAVSSCSPAASSSGAQRINVDQSSSESEDEDEDVNESPRDQGTDHGSSGRLVICSDENVDDDDCRRGIDDDDCEGKRIESCDEEDKNDSAVQDMSIDLSTSETSFSKARETRGLKTEPSEGSPVKVDTPCRGDKDRNEGVGSREEGGDPSAVDLSRRDSDLLISSPQSYTDQVRDAIRRRLLTTSTHPMLHLGLSPLGIAFPSAASSPGVPCFSPTDMFKKSRESPFARSISANLGVSWAASLANSHVTGRSITSAPSPMDIRLLATPFSPPHLTFVPPPNMAAFGLPPPPMRKSIVQRSPPVHASLHNMLTSAGSGGGANSIQVTSPSANHVLHDKRSAPMKASLDSSSDSVENKGGQSEGGELLGSTVGGGGDQRVYRCDYCNKTFLFKSKYHEHLPVHTSARPFQCHLCSRTYKYKYDLRVHLRTHLGIPTKSTVCPFCTDKFGSNKMLRQHIRDAHREQQLIGEEQCARTLEGMRPPPPTDLAVDYTSRMSDSSTHNGSDNLDSYDSSPTLGASDLSSGIVVVKPESHSVVV